MTLSASLLGVYVSSAHAALPYLSGERLLSLVGETSFFILENNRLSISILIIKYIFGERVIMLGR